MWFVPMSGFPKSLTFKVRDRAMKWLNEYTEELSQKTMRHVIDKEKEIAAAITAKQLAVNALMEEVDEELGDDVEDEIPAGSLQNPEDFDQSIDFDREIDIVD